MGSYGESTLPPHLQKKIWILQLLKWSDLGSHCHVGDSHSVEKQTPIDRHSVNYFEQKPLLTTG